jgi:hypothetical protein
MVRASWRMLGQVWMGQMRSMAWIKESAVVWSALAVLGTLVHCIGGRVVVGRGFVSSEELNMLIRWLMLACVAAVEVTWRAKSRIIGVDALSWQVSRSYSTRL